MEVFDMNNKITEGMEVLIFRYIPEWGYNQDNEHYIIGTVLKKEKYDDVSCHDNLPAVRGKIDLVMIILGRNKYIQYLVKMEKFIQVTMVWA